MAQLWTHDTAWRQGQALDPAAIQALGLRHATQPEGTCVVVVTHDCDLATDDLAVEPSAEVIIGRLVPSLDGNYAWGKSPRTLHLPAKWQESEVVVELVTTAKNLVPKESLGKFGPDISFALEPIQLSVLRNWLAVRYNRAAFADAFVDRMQRRKLDAGLAKKIAAYGAHISAVYFLVDDGRELNRASDSPYELSIVLLYSSGADPQKAEQAADKAEAEIERLFSGRCYDKEKAYWSDVHLKTCLSISEDEFPVSKAKRFTQWRLEYMSFRSAGDPTATPDQF